MSVEVGARSGPTARAVLGAVVCTAIMCAAALAAIVVNALMLGHARRFVMDVIVARLAALSLWVLGIRVEVVGDAPWRSQTRQTVYVFNHTSSLDIYVGAVLGLPRVRTFLKRVFLLFVPMGVLAWLSGTFFTMPQTQPAARTRLFQRATAELRRTGESVFLSPEGTRVTTGEIGPLNKGAFHLAAALGAPIVPLFFETPRHVDPGKSVFAGAGVVRVHVLPTIETSGWDVADIARHRDDVRGLFVAHNARVRSGEAA